MRTLARPGLLELPASMPRLRTLVLDHAVPRRFTPGYPGYLLMRRDFTGTVVYESSLPLDQRLPVRTWRHSMHLFDQLATSRPCLVRLCGPMLHSTSCAMTR